MIIKLTFQVKAHQKQVTAPKKVIPTHTQQISQVKVTKEYKPEMPEYKIKLSKPLQEYTWNICNTYSVPYSLVLALMYQESRFNINAVNVNRNTSRDEGLGQLNQRYSKEFASRAGIDPKVFDPFNPYHNIKTCIVHISDLEESWIDTGFGEKDSLFTVVLTAYNRGTVNTKNLIDKYGTAETDYSKNVLKWQRQLEMKGELK